MITDPVGLVSKAIPAHLFYRHSKAIYTFLNAFSYIRWTFLCLTAFCQFLINEYVMLYGSIIVAKTTSGFNSHRTIRQYAYGLLLESPFVPSGTDR